jgi:hypothetical protein
MKITTKIKVVGFDKKSIEHKLKYVHSEAFVKQINRSVVGEIKKLISAGVSPVRGKGRFVEYKNIEEYPGKLKPNRPVNLKLSGRLLYHYIAKALNAKVLEIGFPTDTPKEVKVIAQAHNEGTRLLKGFSTGNEARKKFKRRTAGLGLKAKNLNEAVQGRKGIPERRIVPLKGESFTVSVVQKIKNIYAQRLAQLFSKK